MLFWKRTVAICFSLLIFTQSDAASVDIPSGQEEIVAAMERQKGLRFVEVVDVEVSKVLPDDRRGRRHQKWMFRLANGEEVLAVYNIDITDRVPVEEGDRISLAGEYIWDRGGGLIHWLHEDPRDRRPDGFVDHEGTRYGDVNGSSH